MIARQGVWADVDGEGFGEQLQPGQDPMAPMGERFTGKPVFAAQISAANAATDAAA